MEVLSILYTATYKNNIFSVDAEKQEMLCCQYTDINIVKHFKDEDILVNSNLFEREGFSKVMEELKSGKYKKLIIYNSYVLGIDIKIINKCIRRLNKMKVTLFYVSLNTECSGLMGELVCGISNYVESTYFKMSICYYIFTGKKDNTSTLEYRGIFSDLNHLKNLLEDSSIGKDNYFQIMRLNTM